jgi:hypothetical protein
MEKRGEFAEGTLGKWIFAIIVLVIILLAIGVLVGKGSGFIEQLKSIVGFK